jgi:hypothetical protein
MYLGSFTILFIFIGGLSLLIDFLSVSLFPNFLTVFTFFIGLYYKFVGMYAISLFDDLS